MTAWGNLKCGVVGTITKNLMSLHDVCHSADVQKRGKKVVSDSAGQVDFAIGKVNSVHKLFPNV